MSEANKLPLKEDERTIVAVTLARVYQEIQKTTANDLQARLAIGRAADHLYTASDKQQILEQFNAEIGDRSFSRG